MIQLEDLAQAAEDLRKLGIDAWHDFIYGPHCCLEGLDVGEEFFPLWELLLPENQMDLQRLDFTAIAARRGPGWSVEAPRSAHRAAG